MYARSIGICMSYRAVLRETVSHEFKFHVFTEDDDQLTVFDAVARPAVEVFCDLFVDKVFFLYLQLLFVDIMGGYNSTIITYGQTSSGKTYTMQGDDTDCLEDQGIVPRAAIELFKSVHIANAKLDFTVQLSYIEIYMELVSDLLNPQRA